jgi:hypothetical protein
MAISIKNITLNTKEMQVAFPGHPSFLIKIGYISNELTRKIYRDSHVTKFDESNGINFEDLDSDKFSELFCKHAIVGWSGLTLDTLSKLILIDIVKDANLEEEVEFSVDNALHLYLNCTAFNKWVSSNTRSLTQFRN